VGGLEEWPEQRREALLWRFALTLDYEGVDDYVRTGTHLSCLNAGWQPPEGQTTAVLGEVLERIREGGADCTGPSTIVGLVTVD
jgi:hypothetical protein